MAAGARGEADAQNITVLAMWMIEHPCSEDERDEPHGRDGAGHSQSSGSFCGRGGRGSGGGKAAERNSYLASPGDGTNTGASEMEEGFSERYSKE